MHLVKLLRGIRFLVKARGNGFAGGLVEYLCLESTRYKKKAAFVLYCIEFVAVKMCKGEGVLLNGGNSTFTMQTRAIMQQSFHLTHYKINKNGTTCLNMLD